MLGVAVIDGKATEVIDAHHFLLQAHPDWFQVADTVTVRSGGRILFVDDSTFFRELLAPVLRGQGYEVVTASDGREALSKFERGERFDVVLSDIDMPHVDGFSLAEAVRARGDFGTPKLVALTGRATAADRERGEEAGFDEYLVKLDRERLLATIDSICQAEAA